ncbi:TPA: lmo0937 family membrane protein [Candidatus Shapirobacteria bacterium]|nr:lmo0937 family membrane protein [Candidatus Shapirobacteria bacterium]HCU55071.1 lmo0937 family membrane protein [Candidatus Shapirobacteria bacterium]
MINIIIILLVISWLGGFSLHIGGGLIHLLLVIAVIIFLARLLGL